MALDRYDETLRYSSYRCVTTLRSLLDEIRRPLQSVHLLDNYNLTTSLYKRKKVLANTGEISLFHIEQDNHYANLKFLYIINNNASISLAVDASLLAECLRGPLTTLKTQGVTVSGTEQAMALVTATLAAGQLEHLCLVDSKFQHAKHFVTCGLKYVPTVELHGVITGFSGSDYRAIVDTGSTVRSLTITGRTGRNFFLRNTQEEPYHWSINNVLRSLYISMSPLCIGVRHTLCPFLSRSTALQTIVLELRGAEDTRAVLGTARFHPALRSLALFWMSTAGNAENRRRINASALTTVETNSNITRLLLNEVCPGAEHPAQPCYWPLTDNTINTNVKLNRNGRAYPPGRGRSVTDWLAAILDCSNDVRASYIYIRTNPSALLQLRIPEVPEEDDEVVIIGVQKRRIPVQLAPAKRRSCKRNHK